MKIDLCEEIAHLTVIAKKVQKGHAMQRVLFALFFKKNQEIDFNALLSKTPAICFR